MRVRFVLYCLPVLAVCAGASERNRIQDRTQERDSRIPSVVAAIPTQACSLAIRAIELRRRNWENHGTDVTIDADGNFVVAVAYLGRHDAINHGRLSPTECHSLRDLIVESDFYSLPDEFEAPFKTDTAWWGYSLKMSRNGETKTVRFHSEDDSVPMGLMALVDEIRLLTAARGR
jgi:hypothetical protein